METRKTVPRKSRLHLKIPNQFPVSRTPRLVRFPQNEHGQEKWRERGPGWKLEWRGQNAGNERRTVGKARDIYLQAVSRSCRVVQFPTITKHNATERPRRSPFVGYCLFHYGKRSFNRRDYHSFQPCTLSIRARCPGEKIHRPGANFTLCKTMLSVKRLLVKVTTALSDRPAIDAFGRRACNYSIAGIGKRCNFSTFNRPSWKRWFRTFRRELTLCLFELRFVRRGHFSPIRFASGQSDRLIADSVYTFWQLEISGEAELQESNWVSRNGCNYEKVAISKLRQS